MTDPVDWAITAARAAASKTDERTVVLDVGKVLSIAGWFVITSGSNPRQVRTIAEEIEAKVAEHGGPRPIRIEGADARQWILMDYGDFIVHVFLNEVRDFYDLERLWADVDTVEWGP